MRPLSLVLLVLSFALPPIAQSAELLPIAAPSVGPVRGKNSLVSVAYGPDGGVAVWKVGFGAIWGVPLDRDGRQVAPARWILGETNGLDQPEVRFIDGAFVLWWIRSFPRATRVAALDPELRPLEPRSVGVSTTAPLAWNGSIALAATGEYPRVYDVTVHFLDRSFARLRSDSLADLGAVVYTSAVALADGTFALVAAGERGRFLIRYSLDGERLGPPRSIDAYQATGTVATDGESILIVGGGASVANGPAQLRVLVIRSDGTNSESSVAIPDSWRSITEIEVQWASGAYTIAVAAGTVEGRTTDVLDLHAARLSAEGALLEDFTTILTRPGLERGLALVRAAEKLVLVFGLGGWGTEEIFSIALPPAGPLARSDLTAPDARISDTAASQGSAFAASDGVGWMVVWMESTATRQEIRSVVLDRDGRPVRIPSTDAAGGLFQLAGANVAFNGIDYVVAWSEWGALHARRFRPDGTPVDQQPLVLTHGVTVRPSVAAKDGVTLMSWVSGGAVRGILFFADGSASPPLLLSPAPHDDGEDRISYESEVLSAGENGFLVGFRERRAFPCYFPGSCWSEYRAKAQLIARDGQLRGGLMTFDAKGVASAAGAGGTFLLALDSGRGVLIDGTSGMAIKSFPLTRAAAVFEWGGEYTVVADVGESLLVKRLRPDGTVVRTEEAAIDGRAAAASASGALLVISGRQILEAPYYGSPAVVAGVADAFTPATSDRRRVVSR